MENIHLSDKPDQDILDEQDYVELCRAGSGKRLVNYIVDYVRWTKTYVVVESQSRLPNI